MTADVTSTGREAARVLLDATAGHAPGTDVDAAAAQNLALCRLAEIEAVVAAFDDRSGTIRVDWSDLAGGALVLTEWLVTQLTAAAGVDREVVLHNARAFLDKLDVDDR
jgi:hypothetical protein